MQVIQKSLPKHLDLCQKQIPISQNFNELFEHVRNQTLYRFVETNSRYLTISDLTPKINTDALRLLLQEYGVVKDIQLRVFYQEYKGNVVAHIEYQNPQEAQRAYTELQQKIENGFNFKIQYGAPIIQRSKTIKVPNPSLRTIIDRLARIIVYEGSGFENALIEREANNPLFAFLSIVVYIINQDCDEQEYYKWRVYSLMNGDNEKQWKTDPFKIFLSGKVYYPPSVDTEENVVQSSKKDQERLQINDKVKEKKSNNWSGANILSDEDRAIFHQMIRELNNQKQVIGKAMVYCMENHNCSADIVMTIRDSLLENITWNQKLCRLYLISDILHNSSNQQQGFWIYKIYFQYFLPQIFDNLQELFNYKEKVFKLIQIWREWNIYDSKFLKGLEVTFMHHEGGQAIECSAKNIYQDRFMRIDKEAIENYCQSRGLPTEDKTREQIVELIIQYKFYQRKNLISKTDQILKCIPIYKFLVDKDQQTIISQQRQSFNVQIQQLQEFYKLLRKRYMNIINDREGEEIDELDEQLYDLAKQVEHQKQERSYYQLMDGSELTQDEIKCFDDKKAQVITYHSIQILLNKQETPQFHDKIDEEVYKFRQHLQSVKIYSSQRIDDFVRFKRSLLTRLDQQQKEQEKQAQIDKEKQRMREMEKERDLQKSKEKQRDKDYNRDYNRNYNYRDQDRRDSDRRGESRKISDDRIKHSSGIIINNNQQEDREEIVGQYQRAMNHIEETKRRAIKISTENDQGQIQEREEDDEYEYDIYMNRIIKQLFSTINEIDRQKFNQVTDWWSSSGSMSALFSYNYLRVNFIHQIIERQQTNKSLSGLNVLDVGVGGGILSESLRRLDANVIGIDVSQQSIDQANQHKSISPDLKDDSKLQYILTSPENLQIDYKFDFITAMEVIEHVKDKNLFIHSLQKLLKPQGYLLLSTINKTTESWLKVIVGAEYISGLVQKGTHNWEDFITPDNLKQLLQQNNLNTIALRGAEYCLLTGEFSYGQNMTMYLLAAQNQI